MGVSVEGCAEWRGKRLPRYTTYLFFDVRFDAPRFGTFAPFDRASLKPIATACFRLVTLPPDPLRSVPFFFRLIADSTALLAPFPYFAIAPSKTLTEHRACHPPRDGLRHED
jgi:hypothetical protein